MHADPSAIIRENESNLKFSNMYYKYKKSRCNENGHAL